MRRVDRDRSVLGGRKAAVVDRLGPRTGVVENDVDPVIGSVRKGDGAGEHRAAAVAKIAIKAVAGGGQGAIGDGGSDIVEIVISVRVIAGIGPVGGVIGLPAWIATGRGEIDLLPAAGGLAGEGCARQQLAARRPQIAKMRPGVTGSLVEADAGDFAGSRGGEFHAEFDADLLRIGIGVVDERGVIVGLKIDKFDEGVTL